MKNFSLKNLYLIRIISNKLKAGDRVKSIDLSKIAGLPIMGCPMTKFVSDSICQKYIPTGLANLSKVIASEAKQSPGFAKRLLRRCAPRNDRLSEYIFDIDYTSGAGLSGRTALYH